MQPLPHQADYLYHSRFCEENIWHLCQRPEFSTSEVIFIASRGECFPMLCQHAAPTPTTPLLWDYHVILLWYAANRRYLLDFDTTLAFCTPLSDYMRHSFLAEHWLKPAFIPLFRLIPTKDYVANFLSDRRHMQTSEGWLATPPPWPPISTSTSNLSQFTDMTDPTYGRILTASQLLQD